MGNEGDIPRAIRVIDRVVRPFDLHADAPLCTVSELIDYVVESTSTPPDAAVTILRPPLLSERRSEAFRQLQKGLKAVGARVPETMDSDLAPGELLPVKRRPEKWRELSERLDCELPELKPTPWFSVVSFLVGPVPMLAIWAYLLHAFGFDDNPAGLVGWIAVGCLMLVCTILASAVSMAVLAAVAVRGFDCQPRLVPFRSVAEMAGWIEGMSRPWIDEALARQAETTIQDYVLEVIADEYDVSREAIGADFRLVRGYDEEGSG